jgi:adenylate cyclase
LGAIIRHAQLWLSIAILVTAVLASWQEPLLVVGLRERVFDAYQRWKPREYLPSPVRVIDIDEESLSKIGQWPWPRTYIAELINRLREQGAAVVAFDMLFAEPDRTSPARVIPLWEDIPELQRWAGRLQDHDDVLAAAVSAGGVVTGFALTDGEGGSTPVSKAGFAIAGENPRPFLPSYSAAVTTLPAIETLAAGNGALNVTIDEDGVLRRVPLLVRLGDKIFPSLTPEALRVVQGASSYIVKSAGASGEQNLGARTGITHLRIGSIAAPTDSEGQFWVYYSKPQDERYIPAWRVLEGTVERENIEGFIFLVGSSATGLQDLHATPLRNPQPGVVVQAQVLEQMIHQSFLTRPDWAKGAEILLMICLGAVVMVLGARIGPLWTAIIGGTAVATACAASWYAFSQYQMLLDPLFPSATVIAVYLVFSLLGHLRSEHEQRWVRRAFSSYLSPSLVEELVNNPKQLKLSGERRELTFVFTDLAGFTALVEKSEPSVIVPLLNDYLDGMIRIAFQYDGTIDKIVGDAIHLIFGAPIAQPDHAARAVACALEMDAFADGHARQKQSEGIPLGETRIGVNTGTTVIGNFGGELRFDYTAHGDAINTAARLESANKQLGIRICVSRSTIEACPNFIGRPAGTLILKGKTEGIDVFEPLTEEAAASEHTAAYLDAFLRMERGDPGAWEAFVNVVERYPEDGLARFHLNRLDDGESGVTVVMKEK